MNDFKEQYRFDPNAAAREIASEQLVSFAELVKGTPNEDFLAFKDPKMQELIDFIMCAIILENERINGEDTFPIQIYRRYKSDNSLREKMEEWEGRPEKKGMQVTDYLGFKIIPEAEHSIFYSGGDPVLQEKMNKREQTRSFISETYRSLSENPNMTFSDYAAKCQEVLQKLKDVFPEQCDARRAHYDYLADVIKEELETYIELVEDPNEEISLARFSRLTNVNIRRLLSELTLNYPNEVTLYKLRNDLLNTFQNSELLRTFRNFYISFIK